MTTATQDAPAMPPPAEVKGGVVTYLQLQGATRAAEFYQKAFAAEVASMVPPDDQGRTMHIHLYINGSSVMLSDFYPEHGHAFKPAQGFTLCIMTEEVDAWFDRAAQAGCEVVMPLADMFWRDRYGELRDPFGVSWAMNGRKL